MGKFLFVNEKFFQHTCVLDREFDEPPANDNDHPVKFVSPRDTPPLSE